MFETETKIASTGRTSVSGCSSSIGNLNRQLSAGEDAGTMAAQPAAHFLCLFATCRWKPSGLLLLIVGICGFLPATCRYLSFEWFCWIDGLQVENDVKFASLIVSVKECLRFVESRSRVLIWIEWKKINVKSHLPIVCRFIQYDDRWWNFDGGLTIFHIDQTIPASSGLAIFTSFLLLLLLQHSFFLSTFLHKPLEALLIPVILHQGTKQFPCSLHKAAQHCSDQSSSQAISLPFAVSTRLQRIKPSSALTYAHTISHTHTT